MSIAIARATFCKNSTIFAGTYRDARYELGAPIETAKEDGGWYYYYTFKMWRDNKLVLACPFGVNKDEPTITNSKAYWKGIMASYVERKYIVHVQGVTTNVPRP